MSGLRPLTSESDESSPTPRNVSSLSTASIFPLSAIDAGLGVRVPSLTWLTRKAMLMAFIPSDKK